MNSIRCVKCNLLNFASSTHCKRCNTPLILTCNAPYSNLQSTMPFPTVNNTQTVNSVKCKNCALTNFASSTHCKRCNAPLLKSNNNVQPNPQQAMMGNYNTWSYQPSNERLPPHYQQTTETEDEPESKPIDGFLGLLPVYLILLLILATINFIAGLRVSSRPELKVFTETNSPFYYPLFSTLVNFEVVVSAFVIVFSLILLLLFFRKSSSFLLCANFFFIVFAICLAADIYYGSDFVKFVFNKISSISVNLRDKETVAKLKVIRDNVQEEYNWLLAKSVIALICTLLWCFYLNTANRVKETFANWYMDVDDVPIQPLQSQYQSAPYQTATYSSVQPIQQSSDYQSVPYHTAASETYSQKEAYEPRSYTNNSNEFYRETKETEETTIGGFLMVFVVYLVLLLIRAGSTLFQALTASPRHGVVSMDGPFSNYLSYYFTEIECDITQILFLTFIFAAAITLFLLLRFRRSSFRALVIIFFSIIIVERFVLFLSGYMERVKNFMLVNSRDISYFFEATVYADIIIGIIFIVYFLVSYRVGNTFTND